jgi:hypothetical protein
MKILVTFFLFSLLACSCEKDATNIAVYYDSVTNFNWCAYDQIDCYGDSFTLGAGTWSYPSQLAAAAGKTVNNYGVGGESSSQVLTRYKANPNHDNPTIIWVGKNNSWETDRILSDIAEMIPPHQLFFIVTTWGTNAVTDWKGDPTQTWGGMLNYVYTERSRRLVELYHNHTIYLLPLLQSHADGSPADSLAIVHNVCPISLDLDPVHLNTKGYTILVNEIMRRLAPCGNVKNLKQL